MRFYTALLQDKETVFISFDGGQTAYTAHELGINLPDLNTIIKNWTPELREKLALISMTLKTFAGKNTAANFSPLPVAGLKLCAPIPHP